MQMPPAVGRLLVSAAACLLACGDSVELSTGNAEPVPKADRQSWNSKLVLQGPASTVTVHLPFAQDFDERKLTLGEGGVAIEYVDRAAGVDSTTAGVLIRARRLALEHEDNRIALAGSVAVETADSVSLTCDSLRWTRTDDLIEVPGWAAVERPGGSFRARDLSATTTLDRWSSRNVSGSVAGTAATGSAYDVRIRARRDSSVRSSRGHLKATYYEVSAVIDGRTVGGDRALFDEEDELVTFAGAVVLEDSTRTIRADRLEHDLAHGTSTALGSVVVEEQDWRLQAREIEVHTNGERWSSSGDPVLLEVDGRSLSASRLVYEGGAGQASFTAIGGERSAAAEFRDGERLLRADSLSYRRDADRVEAHGDVTLTGPEFDGIATAQQALLALDSERAQLSGAPRLVRRRPNDDDLVIRAPMLEFDLSGRQMRGEGGIEVSAGELELRAASGRFDSGADRLTLAAGVELVEGAADTIRSDSMVVALKDGEVVDVLLPRTLAGSIATSASQASWLEAGEGHLFLEAGRVRTLTLAGDARVTHRAFDREAINRFTGAEVTMSFTADGQLISVIAEGDAQVISRLPDVDAAGDESGADDPAVDEEAGGSVNRVSASRLEITLEDGAVVEVKASESVEGEYVPSSTNARTEKGGG